MAETVTEQTELEDLRRETLALLAKMSDLIRKAITHRGDPSEFSPERVEQVKANIDRLDAHIDNMERSL